MNDFFQPQKLNSETRPSANPTFRPLIIGRGKLAKHLLHYFNLKHIPTDHLPDARALTSATRIEQNHPRATCVWLAISDQALAPVRKVIDTRLPVIHSSATTPVSNALTMHPLMTFGPELYPLATYEKMSFTLIAEEARDFERFTNVFFSVLPHPHQMIAQEKRAFYHALCVMTSNFPQILWQAISEYSDGFKPLLAQSSQNFLDLGSAALTGPLVRGDSTTIEKNLAALSDTPFFDLYRSFVNFYSQQKASVSDDHRT